MLRQRVQQAPVAKMLKLTFGDRDEWKRTLGELHTEGKLIYNQDRDEIIMPKPVDATAAAATP